MATAKKYTKSYIDKELDISSSWTISQKRDHIKKIFRYWNAKTNILQGDELVYAEKQLDLCATAMAIYKKPAPPKKKPAPYKKKPASPKKKPKPDTPNVSVQGKSLWFFAKQFLKAIFALLLITMFIVIGAYNNDKKAAEEERKKIAAEQEARVDAFWKEYYEREEENRKIEKEKTIQRITEAEEKEKQKIEAAKRQKALNDQKERERKERAVEKELIKSQMLFREWEKKQSKAKECEGVKRAPRKKCYAVNIYAEKDDTWGATQPPSPPGTIKRKKFLSENARTTFAYRGGPRYRFFLELSTFNQEEYRKLKGRQISLVADFYIDKNGKVSRERKITIRNEDCDVYKRLNLKYGFKNGLPPEKVTDDIKDLIRGIKFMKTDKYKSGYCATMVIVLVLPES